MNDPRNFYQLDCPRGVVVHTEPMVTPLVLGTRRYPRVPLREIWTKEKVAVPESAGPTHMVSKLIALNKFGFFTCSSQPPLDTGSVKQKGYVEGFITAAIVNDLLEFLKSRKDCYFQLDNGQMQHNFPCLVGNSCLAKKGTRYNVTVDDGREYTNLWIRSDFRRSCLHGYQGNVWKLLEESGVAFELAMKEYGGSVGAEDVMLEFFGMTVPTLESHMLDL